MADYNQIKTITFDDTTLGMAEGLGTTSLQENTRLGAVAANTEYSGVSITFTEKGAYVMRAGIYFPAASTTGATQHSFSVYSEGATAPFFAVSQIDASNGVVQLETVGVVNVANPPLTFTTKFQCNRAIAANSGLLTQIRASKIVRMPRT